MIRFENRKRPSF